MAATLVKWEETRTAEQRGGCSSVQELQFECSGYYDTMIATTTSTTTTTTRRRRRRATTVVHISNRTRSTSAAAASVVGKIRRRHTDGWERKWKGQRWSKAARGKRGEGGGEGGGREEGGRGEGGGGRGEEEGGGGRRREELQDFSGALHFHNSVLTCLAGTPLNSHTLSYPFLKVPLYLQVAPPLQLLQQQQRRLSLDSVQTIAIQCHIQYECQATDSRNAHPAPQLKLAQRILFYCL